MRSWQNYFTGIFKCGKAAEVILHKPSAIVAEYPTIGEGADTKVLVPQEDWKAIQAKLRKEELTAGFQESYREAKGKQKAGAKGKTWDELIEHLKSDD
jgi:hypothetical protein